MREECCLTTFTGIVFDLSDPQPEMINILDIAHHLSQVPHWGGAARYHYSVAQHSVLVSTLVPEHLRRVALMHDAAEYVYGDDTRPKKKLFPDLRIAEKKCMAIIAHKYGSLWPEPESLSYYDDLALAIEARNLMPDNAFPEGKKFDKVLEDMGPAVRKMTPKITSEKAEAMFLQEFRVLFGKQS